MLNLEMESIRISNILSLKPFQSAPLCTTLNYTNNVTG